MVEFNVVMNALFQKQCLIEQDDYKDFMSAMPEGSVDLILTDPPYCISKETGFKKVVSGEKRFAVSMDFGDWDSTEIDLNLMAKLSYNCLRAGGSAIIWYDLWKIGNVKQALEDAGFKMFRLIIWQKTNPVPLNMKATYLSNSREVAISCVKGGKPTFNSEYDTGVYSHPIPRHGGKRIHPTQKPAELFKDLIRKHSKIDDLVIDPFLGSGTTAVAAAVSQRRFAGCDINNQYVEAAKQRIGEIK